MNWRRVVSWGLALFLLLTGVAIWAKADHGDQVLAVTSRVLGVSPARLYLAGGPKLPNGPIDSTAGLVAALKQSQAGDTIFLAPGVYSGLSLGNLSLGSGVTITSADPSSLAVITDFRMNNVQGLTFSKLELATIDQPELAAKGVSHWAFNINKSSDIHFDQVKVHGTLDGDVSTDVRGIAILNSKNVSITNSEFQQLDRALAIGQTQNIKVSGNYVHDIRSDGLNFAEVSNVEVTGNTLRDFKPVGKDHPDAIQFWTSGTKTPSHDILISSNIILRGDGEYTQGIFLRDQIGTLPYERVTISDNLIVGTGYNGIRIQGATDLKLTGNELVSFEGDNKTYLLVQAADRVVATGNSATAISFDKSTNVTQDGNVTTKFVNDLGQAAIKKWIEVNPSNASHLQGLLPIDFGPEETTPGLDPLLPVAFEFTMFGGPPDFMIA